MQDRNNLKPFVSPSTSMMSIPPPLVERCGQKDRRVPDTSGQHQQSGRKVENPVTYASNFFLCIRTHRMHMCVRKLTIGWEPDKLKKNIYKISPRTGGPVLVGSIHRSTQRAHFYYYFFFPRPPTLSLSVTA